MISDMTSLISSVYIPFHGFTLISALFAFPRTTLSINSGDGVIKLLQMLNKFVFARIPSRAALLFISPPSVSRNMFFVCFSSFNASTGLEFISPSGIPPPPASCLLPPAHTLTHYKLSDNDTVCTVCFSVVLPVPASVKPRGSRPAICPSAEVKKKE